MPAARGAHSVAAVDGMIYAIGGWNTWGREVSTVEAYDPAANTWTTKADMPTARGSSAIAVVDGKIYVIGGNDSTSAPGVTSVVEAYDPATDTWTRKADMPTARLKLAACVVGGQIYAFGGSIVWGWEVPAVPTVEVYDPATDTWNQTSDMPTAKWGHSASVVAGKVYIIGGIVPSIGELFEAGKLEWDEALELNSISHMYDPTTDRWTTAANIPNNRTRHAAAVVDGKIYAIGGDFGGQNEIVTTSTVEEFDPGLSGTSPSVSPGGKLLETWGQVKKVQ